MIAPLRLTDQWSTTWSREAQKADRLGKLHLCRRRVPFLFSFVFRNIFSGGTTDLFPQLGIVNP